MEKILEKININGQIFDKETEKNQAKVSVYDRGFLYGDSIYEVVKTQDRKLVFWPEHFERLTESANRLRMTLPFTEKEILGEILKTLKASNCPEAYMRLIVTRGPGYNFTLDPSEVEEKGNYVIFARPINKVPAQLYEEGVELVISSIQRNSVKALDPKIKSGNYLNSVLAHSEAKTKKVYDALMFNEHSELAEGPTFNIFLIKNKEYFTPKLETGILKGITRKVLIEALKADGKLVHEKSLSRADLESADECFITSSTKELLPVNKVGSKVFGSAGMGFKTANSLYRDLRDQKTNSDNFTY